LDFPLEQLEIFWGTEDIFSLTKSGLVSFDYPKKSGSSDSWQKGIKHRTQSFLERKELWSLLMNSQSSEKGSTTRLNLFLGIMRAKGGAYDTF
jgi:hypothetical protein